jgi:tetratricopeptide (TPR) repeat protein
MRRAVLAFLCLAPTLAGADEVLLNGGGKVAGVIVERTASSIVVEVGPGLVTLPLSRVHSIQEGPTPLALYRERASGLSRGDVAGWLALGRWARQQDLLTQSREAFARALSIDPASGEANEALGRVLVGEHWVSAEEGYRARGLVPFDGRWVTPAEHAALLREEAAADEAYAARVEGEARAREAEARAREAEARARAAEAEARQAETGYGGMGLGYGAAGVPYLPYGGFVAFPRFSMRHHAFRGHAVRSPSHPNISHPSFEHAPVARAAPPSSPLPRPGSVRPHS